MKNRIIAAFILLVFLSLSGCGGPASPADTSNTAVTGTTAADTSVQTMAEHTAETTAEPKQHNGLQVIDFTYENPAGEVIYHVKSVADIIGANPWKSAWKIEKLPVFVNRYPVGHGGALYEVTADALDMVKKNALAVAGALGLTVESENSNSEDAARYTAKCGNIEIYSHPAYITVSLEPGQSLITVPQSYAIKEYSVKKDLESIILDRWGQLRAKLGAVKPVKNPTADVRFSYSRTGKINLESGRILDMSEDKLTAMLNYSFDYTEFRIYPDDTSLNSIAFVKYDLSEKLGDYPVISADAAKAKLLSGDYISTLTDFYLKGGKISSIDIAHCELLYLTDLIGQRYFVPAYRFFVALDPDNKIVSEPGYIAYGEFWVPAVESGYIEVIKP